MVKYYKSFIFFTIPLAIISLFSCKLENRKIGFYDGIYNWQETKFSNSSRVITPDSVDKNYYIIIKGYNVDFYEDDQLIDQGNWYYYGQYDYVVISGNNTTDFKKREYYFYQSEINYFTCFNFPFVDFEGFGNNKDPNVIGRNLFVKQP